MNPSPQTAHNTQPALAHKFFRRRNSSKMGRKKTRAAVASTADDGADADAESSIPTAGLVPADAAPAASGENAPVDPQRLDQVDRAQELNDDDDMEDMFSPDLPIVAPDIASTVKTPLTTPSVAASGYAMTSHSGELIGADYYVSSSESSVDNDDDEDDVVDVVLLASSRLGLMRRGMVGSLPTGLTVPRREWVRSKDGSAPESDENVVVAAATTTTADQVDKTEQVRKKQEEDELQALDPAERAAWLLKEKQRKLEEAKIVARYRESSRNAGREPATFSNRTAFDIKFSQIEDKPWERGGGHGTLEDYFNYNLNEAEWLDYGQQQLAIREELTKAHAENRPPDPTIVPVPPSRPEDDDDKADDNDNGETKAMSIDNSGTGKEEVDPSGSSGNPSSIENASERDPRRMESDQNAKKESDEAKNIVVGPMRPPVHAWNTLSGDAAGTEAALKEQKLQQEEMERQKALAAAGLGGAWGAGVAPDSMLARLIAEQEQQAMGNHTDRGTSPSKANSGLGDSMGSTRQGDQTDKHFGVPGNRRESGTGSTTAESNQSFERRYGHPQRQDQGESSYSPFASTTDGATESGGYNPGVSTRESHAPFNSRGGSGGPGRGYHGGRDGSGRGGRSGWASNDQLSHAATPPAPEATSINSSTPVWMQQATGGTEHGGFSGGRGRGHGDFSSTSGGRFGDGSGRFAGRGRGPGRGRGRGENSYQPRQQHFHGDDNDRKRPRNW
jgi:Fip1 motif